MHVKLTDSDREYLEEMYIPHPIIGAISHNPEQGVILLDEKIDDAVGALHVKLTDSDREYLEEMYIPHPIIGAISHNPEQGVILLDEKIITLSIPHILEC